VVVGDQVVVAVFEGGDHVERDHLAVEVVDVLDAEVDPDGAAVGADPGGAVMGGEHLPDGLEYLAGVLVEPGSVPQHDHDVDVAQRLGLGVPPVGTPHPEV
jgi:hypothetical protein